MFLIDYDYVVCVLIAIYLSITPIAAQKSTVCKSVSDMYNNKCEIASKRTSCDRLWSCPRGTYWFCETTMNQYYTGCIDCPLTCPTGQYLSTSCSLDASPTNAIPVCSLCSTATCKYGEYMAGCVGSTNRYCTKCTVCSTGYYNKGCDPGGTSPGTCTLCSVCASDTIEVSGSCKGNQDRICTGGYCNVTKPCTELVCSFATQNISQCNNIGWMDFPVSTSVFDPTNFLCLQSATSGSCQSCPVGWKKEDEYCVPCPEGFSCNEVGTPICEGECEIGYWPVCSYNLGNAQGYVTCYPCNTTLQQVVNISHAAPMRSGIVGRSDLCNVYVTCEVGYFLEFSTFGVLQCSACAIPEAYPTLWMFTTYGVTFGDKYSCMYEKKNVANNVNVLGFYGTSVDNMRSCPLGSTSRAGMASSLSDCVSCTNAPMYSLYSMYKVDCAFECIYPKTINKYDRLGLLCQNPDGSQHICVRGVGFYESQGQCQTRLMPWNVAGDDYNERVLQRQMEKKNKQFIWMDLNNNFAVDAMYIYKNRVDVSYCIPFVNTNTVQDAPLFTTNCAPSSKLYYSFYYVYSHPQSQYLFAFLERNQGYNNRYVMWKIYKNGISASGVTSHYRLPGRVCSVTSAYNWTQNVVSETLFVSFCNTSWVSFYDVGDNVVLPKVLILFSQQYVARYTGRVIGKATVGNVDGLRDQALFNKRLWISVSPTRKGHLYIADELHCRLVDVWVDGSDSFLNYAATIGASSCYDVMYGLAFPRLLSVVYNNAFLLFLTNKGIYQLDVKTHTKNIILSMDVIPSNITQIWSNGTHVQVHNLTDVWHFSLLTTSCPVGYASSESQGCVPCAEGYYNSENKSVCLPCTSSNTLVCGIGFELQMCSSDKNTQCKVCPSLPTSPIPGYSQAYVLPGSCTEQAIAFIPPCPSGYYADTDVLSGNFCKLCPVWSSSSAGASGISACVCANGGFLNPAVGLCDGISSPFTQVVASGQTTTTPSWFSVDLYKCSLDECLQSGGKGGCFLSSIVPRVCSPCPSGTVSLNQVWCETCPIGQQANVFQDVCVCTPPSFQIDATCSCPAGFFFDIIQKTCQVCVGNTIQPFHNVIDTQNLIQCSLCADGQVASVDHIQCIDCPLGSYRIGGSSTQCTACLNDTLTHVPQYAPNRNQARCIPCQTSCQPNEKWNVCPWYGVAHPFSTFHVNDVLFFECVPCPVLSTSHAHYINDRADKFCSWECDAGYYYDVFAENANMCKPCHITQCDPGHVLQACSKYSDGSCEQLCVNETMPRANAHYAHGCMWECNNGFVLQTRTFFDKVLEYLCQ